jgi:hypothetical protein
MHLIRQAIQTKWLSPTNHRPARVTAWADAGRVTIPQDDCKSIDDSHQRAAKMLAEKFDWRGEWYQGALPNNSGQVFVCVDGRWGSDITPAFSR